MKSVNPRTNDRINKAFEIYNDNIKLYYRLSNIKPTLPNTSLLLKQCEERSKMKQRLSKFSAHDPLVQLEMQRMNMNYLQKVLRQE